MAWRISALLALLLVLGLAPGCFVFEELDQGKETMDRLSQQSSGSEEGSESAAGDGDAEGEDDPDGWWKKARTLTPGGGGSEGSAEEGGTSKGTATVRCRLADGTRFMRRDECLGRGGTPAG